MNSWFGNVAILANIVGTIAIRIPYAQQSKGMPVAGSKKGPLENALLGLMWIAMVVLPLLAIFTSVLSFGDYELQIPAFLFGVGCLCAALYLFYRSHADLGKYWSISLEIRESHKLITSGVYRSVRHPMYAAIFLQAIAQMFLLANWIAGPACFVAFLTMFALRVGVEERMMLEEFGEAYVSYKNRTKRLIPGLW